MRLQRRNNRSVLLRGEALAHFPLLMLLMVLLSGCRHKDLCDPVSGALEVKFDWKFLSQEARKPAGMRVIFYSEDNAQYYINNISADGAKVYVPDGMYTLIAYNNDSEVVQYDGEAKLDQCHAFTRMTDVNGQHTDESRRKDRLKQQGVNEKEYYKMPEMAWSAKKGSVKVCSGKEMVVLLTPECYTTHVKVRYVNVEKPKNVDKSRLYYIGLPGEYYFKEGKPSADKVVFMSFPNPTPPDAPTEITDENEVFLGNDPDLLVGMELQINLGYVNKGVVKLRVTVTKEMIKRVAPNSYEIIIRERINEPVPIDDEDGFNPSIEEWTREDYVIDM